MTVANYTGVSNVDNTARTQIYFDQGISGFPKSQQAVNATNAKVLLTSSGALHPSKHLRGSYADDRATTPDDTLSQEGSRYLVDHGWTRDSVLTGYYTNSAVTIADTTPREIRDLKVSSTTSSSITITWGAIPGATKYAVGKRNGTGWAWSYPGNVTSWTDNSVQPNIWHDYTVCAGNARGWGRCAFNGRWITASTFFSPTPPTYDVHFLANDRIRFTFSKSGATRYQVLKQSGGSWTVVQDGSSTEYRESSLAQNTTYDYTVRAYVNNAWTEYTNGGSFSLGTYTTR